MPTDKFGRMVPSEAQIFSWDDIPDTLNAGEDYETIKAKGIADLNEQINANNAAEKIRKMSAEDPAKQAKRKMRDDLQRLNQERLEKNKQSLIELLEKNNIHPQNIAVVLSSGRVSDAIKKYPAIYTNKALNEAADDIRIDLEKLGIEIDEQGKVRNYLSLSPELRDNDDMNKDVVVLRVCAKILGRITPSPEQEQKRTIADDLYEHCNNLGLSGASVDAALDHDLLKILTDDGYHGTENQILFDGIKKTIRSLENEHKFIINDKGEPELLGLWDRLNLFTKNKKIAAIKSSPTFKRILGLMTLERELKIAPTLPANRQPTQRTTSANILERLIPKTNIGKGALAATAAAAIGLGTYQGAKTGSYKKATPEKDTTYKIAPETESFASGDTFRRGSDDDLDRAIRLPFEEDQAIDNVILPTYKGVAATELEKIDEYTAPVLQKSKPRSVISTEPIPEADLEQITRQTAEEETRSERRGPDSFELASTLDNKQKQTILEAASTVESKKTTPRSIQKERKQAKKAATTKEVDFSEMENALRNARDKMLGTKTLTSSEKREMHAGLNNIAESVEKITGKKMDRSQITEAFGEKKTNRMPPTIQEKVKKLIQNGTTEDLQTAKKLLSKSVGNKRYQKSQIEAMRAALRQVDNLLQQDILSTFESPNPQASK